MPANDSKRYHLQQAARHLRAIAGAVGPMHAYWDTIHDLEVAAASLAKYDKPGLNDDPSRLPTIAEAIEIGKVLRARADACPAEGRIDYIGAYLFESFACGMLLPLEGEVKP